MEVGLRYLVEKGFPHENEYISTAVKCLLHKEPFDSSYSIKEPKAPNTDYSLTSFGLYLYRSSIILRAGYEHLVPKDHFININGVISALHSTHHNLLWVTLLCKFRSKILTNILKLVVDTPRLP